MTTPVPRSSNVWRWLILFAIAAVVIGILFRVVNDQDRTDSGQQPGVIYKVTTHIVAGALKAPATARFPSFFDEGTVKFRPLGNKRYEISSYVDSQNSFGALVRTKWTAIVSVKGETVSVDALETIPP